MTHQLNILILFVGAVQGWLLSFLLIRKRSDKVSSWIFTAILVTISLQLTSKVISKMWLWENVHYFYNVSYLLPYLIGPLMYLYVRTSNNTALGLIRSDVLHFFPFVFNALWLALLLLTRYSLPHLHPYTHAALQVISLVVYARLALKLATNKERTFIHVLAVSEGVAAITLALMVMYYGRFPDVKLLFITLTVVIYWISYKTLRFNSFEDNDASVVTLKAVRHPKYSHSSLRPEEGDRIEKDLQSAMTSKAFLDPDLTIDTLAAKLGTSRHHLSQVLNERVGKTYNDYINDQRLDEVCLRLSDGRNKKYTIAAIAFDCGFNSVSGFNEIFKKRFSTTPSRYRDQKLNKMTA
jgi:AraC-like DNA-binding protein